MIRLSIYMHIPTNLLEQTWRPLAHYIPPGMSIAPLATARSFPIDAITFDLFQSYLLVPSYRLNLRRVQT